MKSFSRTVAASRSRVALPIAVYPGIALTGATVRDVVTNPRAQAEASLALHDRLRMPAALTAMDLSAEAEAFGCTVDMGDHEIPTVTGRLVTSMAQTEALAVPQVGDKRTCVYLEAARELKRTLTTAPLLAGTIGPYSLAARLAGVSEAMELTLTEPELMHVLLEKATAFLIGYARAFKAAGATGLIMAEPAAGLLSPRTLAEFSSAYVRRIVDAVVDEDFDLILHNCAARLVHLPAILESGARLLHFGAPMDLPAALAKVGPEIILCGNLDPTSVFVQLTPDDLRERTQGLLTATSAHRNFVISSGCDVPATSPLANLERFVETVAGFGLPALAAT